MYTLDEHGNVLIDNEMTSLLEEARRNKTISPRGMALFTGSLPRVESLNRNVFQAFSQRLVSLYNVLRQSIPNSSRRTGEVTAVRTNELRNLFNSSFSDFISAGLQGFTGPVPVVVAGADYHFYLPADGGLIRYLGRLARHDQFSCVSIFIHPMSMDLSDFTRTIDGSSVRIAPSPNMMVVAVRNLFAPRELESASTNEVITLKILQRALQLEKSLPALIQVFRTISRRFSHLEGLWGEDPKFPIVSFRNKMGSMSARPILSISRLMAGNNSALFGDRSVYKVMSLVDKYPFVSTTNPSGDIKWTRPK